MKMCYCRALTATTTRTKTVTGEPLLKKEKPGTHTNALITKKKTQTSNGERRGKSGASGQSTR
jgi:hypothetical protein